MKPPAGRQKQAIKAPSDRQKQAIDAPSGREVPEEPFATRLAASAGGGSLTALPVAHTKGGNIAGYIPTNLISITDGQIYFDARLFDEGVRPAVEVGLSVSRIGSKAQPPVLRDLAGGLRLLSAQLRELKSFARLGAEPEPESRRRLERGRRLREILKQRRLEPLALEDEVLRLVCLNEGDLDDLAPEQVEPFVGALRRHFAEASGAGTGSPGEAAPSRSMDARRRAT